MDEETYKAWWPLHIRAAKEEKLNAQEQEVYEAGLKQMYEEEILDGNIETLRQIRAKIADLEKENAQLREQRARLDEKIAILESNLNERTRQLLGVGD